MNHDQIQLFEDQPIRTAWDAEQEEWYFSVVDVVRVLTEQPDTRCAAKYWSVLKKEGSQCFPRQDVKLSSKQVSQQPLSLE